MINIRKTITWLLVPAFGILGAVVNAQELAAQETELAQENILEEVIVTAQKREAAIQDVPLAVTAITEGLLQDTGIASLDSLGSQVAGVEITNVNPGSNQVVARGISSLSGGSIESTASMGLYVDETPITALSAGLPAVAFWDAARVEVLRGPQGTLFGEGSMAGTIRVVSNKPEADAFSGAFAGGIAQQKDGDTGWYARGMINAPISEGKFAIRASVGYEDQGGWIDVPDLEMQDTNDVERVDAKLAARWLATDKLIVDASVIYQELTVDDTFFQTSPGIRDPLVQFPGLIPLDQLESDYSEYTISTLTLDYDFGNATLVSATSYFDMSGEGIVDLNPQIKLFFSPGTIGRAWQDVASTSELFSQEIRLVSNGDEKLDWTIGGFYKHLDRTVENGFYFEIDSFIPELGPIVGPPFGEPIDDVSVSTTDSLVKSYAIFAEANYEFSESLSLTGGIRYYSDDRELTDVREIPSLILGIPPAVIGPVNGDDNSWSPNLILSWDKSDETKFFARVAKGFRSGGTNLASFNDENVPVDYAAETLWAYEVGMKTTNLIKNVQANWYFYYNDWTDLQLVFLTDDARFNYRDNAGTARSYGSELELFWQATEQWSFNFLTAYTNAKITEDISNALGQPIAESGNIIPFVPKWTLTVGVDWEKPVSDNILGHFHADYGYRSKTFSDPENNLEEENNTYTMINLRAGVRTDQWGAYLVVKNLTDSRDTTMITNLLEATPLLSSNYSRPRTIGVEFIANF